MSKEKVSETFKASMDELYGKMVQLENQNEYIQSLYNPHIRADRIEEENQRLLEERDELHKALSARIGVLLEELEETRQDLTKAQVRLAEKQEATIQHFKNFHREFTRAREAERQLARLIPSEMTDAMMEAAQKYLDEKCFGSHFSLPTLFNWHEFWHNIVSASPVSNDILSKLHQLRIALTFYANSQNYGVWRATIQPDGQSTTLPSRYEAGNVEQDRGERARQALEEVRGLWHND